MIKQQKSGPGNRAIGPGMDGGSYKPLNDHDIKRIHTTALQILEDIGIANPTAELLDYALPCGCVMGEDKRLRFPRSLVEDIIANKAGTLINYGIDPEYDLELGGQQVHMGTAGEAVSILDYKTQTYRPSTLVDLYDAARLVDQLDNIHSFVQPFIASEHSEDLYIHDLNWVRLL